MIRLTFERKSRGWTQTALGQRARVHPTTICLIETGRYRPSGDQLDRLQRALGVTAEDAPRLLEQLPIEPLGSAR